MDELKVMIFGQLEDVTGSSSVRVPLVKDTEGLCAALNSAYPALKGRKFMISVNQKIVRENTLITEGAEIALLPPFSGG